MPRIGKAKIALATTTIPIQDIAAEVGIPDVHYLAGFSNWNITRPPTPAASAALCSNDRPIEN